MVRGRQIKLTTTETATAVLARALLHGCYFAAIAEALQTPIDVEPVERTDTLTRTYLKITDCCRSAINAE